MVNWIVALLLTQPQPAPCAPPPRPDAPPALVVQVVDPLWLPIPGAQVTVVAEEHGSGRMTSTTGREGYAEFWAPREAEYAVEARLVGFKPKRVKGIRIGKQSDASPTAYVQIQLALAGPFVTVE
jgi:hypothetical protein